MANTYDEMIHEGETIAVRVLTLRPDQILVFQTDLLLDRKQAEALHSRIKTALPKGVRFMVLVGGLDLGVSEVTEADGSNVQEGQRS